MSRSIDATRCARAVFYAHFSTIPYCIVRRTLTGKYMGIRRDFCLVALRGVRRGNILYSSTLTAEFDKCFKIFLHFYLQNSFDYTLFIYISIFLYCEITAVLLIPEF